MQWGWVGMQMDSDEDVKEKADQVEGKAIMITNNQRNEYVSACR